MEDHQNNPMPSTGMPDTVFNCVIAYINHPADRSSVSLVSRKWYEIEGISRKHITISICYATTPNHVRRRFPHLESITIKGKPRAAMFGLIPEDWGGYATPWVVEIAESFECLKALHLRRMIVSDSDLEILAQSSRGCELQVLKLDMCMGFSTDGLLHVSKLCKKLRCLFLEESVIVENDSEWLRELALRNRKLESLNFYQTDLLQVRFQDLQLIAENCRSSLVSMKISELPVDRVVFYEVASNLEEFGGGLFNDLEEFGGGLFNEQVDNLAMRVPSKLQSMALTYTEKTHVNLFLPFLSRLRKLDLLFTLLDTDDHCFLIQSCPNLEILETRDVIGDIGLQCLAQCCKRLTRLNIERGAVEEGLVSHTGLIALAQGCSRLESLAANVFDITNEALDCIGLHLTNLNDLKIILLDKEEHVTDLPLDNGVRGLLRGCTKLRKFTLYLRLGGLTDLGLGYIGEYGLNLKDMLLGFTGESDAGLIALSNGCPNLKRLELRGCFFSEQALANAVLRLSSLRYLWVQGYRRSATGRDLLAMARPFWNMELISKVGNDPPSLLAYYSQAGQRRDFPETVTPLYPTL